MRIIFFSVQCPLGLSLAGVGYPCVVLRRDWSRDCGWIYCSEPLHDRDDLRIPLFILFAINGLENPIYRIRVWYQMS